MTRSFWSSLVAVAALAGLVGVHLGAGAMTRPADDRKAIEEVIDRAYIRGIHGDLDEARVRSGFHDKFAMLVLRNNTIEEVRVADWLTRLQTMKQKDPVLWGSETTYKMEFVDATDDAAVAKLQVAKGGKPFSTDYMLLYRFEDGWRIVSKVFAVPR